MSAPTLDGLPRVAAVRALPDHAARLTLEDGQAVQVSAAAPRLLLCPLPDQDGALLLEDAQNTASALHVPAPLLPALLAALPVPQLTPPTLTAARGETGPAGQRCAVLSYRLPTSGEVSEWTAPLPVGYLFAGRRSQGDSTLTVYPDGLPGASFGVPWSLWAAVMPVLAGESA